MPSDIELVGNARKERYKENSSDDRESIVRADGLSKYLENLLGKKLNYRDEMLLRGFWDMRT